MGVHRVSTCLYMIDVIFPFAAREAREGTFNALLFVSATSKSPQCTSSSAWSRFEPGASNLRHSYTCACSSRGAYVRAWLRRSCAWLRRAPWLPDGGRPQLRGVPYGWWTTPPLLKRQGLHVLLSVGALKGFNNLSHVVVVSKTSFPRL
jgi:hypothetical protein